MKQEQIVITALYLFTELDDFEALRKPILNFCLDRKIRGTLLLAKEGINGTVAGTRKSIDDLLNYLRNDPRMSRLSHKESFEDNYPFYRMKVKLKKNYKSYVRKRKG